MVSAWTGLRPYTINIASLKVETLPIIKSCAGTNSSGNTGSPAICCAWLMSHNVRYPLEVYRFFKQIKAQYITFLPLVEPDPQIEGGVSPRTVPAGAWGDFLCTIFEEWKAEDIEKIKVQIFEETARTAFGQEHGLCIFRKTCGDFPVVEHNGDFYSCDHFVSREYHLGNIQETPLVDLLESPAPEVLRAGQMGYAAPILPGLRSTQYVSRRMPKGPPPAALRMARRG